MNPKRKRILRKPGRPHGRPARVRWTVPDCKNFTGYKPCYPDTRCYEKCVYPVPRGTRILIINLDAMGNVLVTTSILPALKRKYPQSHITWITLKNAAPLLVENPLIDRVLLWEPESWLILRQLEFDEVLNVDKSQRSGALAMSVTAARRLGFGINTNGVIIPLNREAEENYLLGLDDHLKFHVNVKTVPQLLCEQFRLAYRQDEYMLHLTAEEEGFCDEYRKQQGLTMDSRGESMLVVGFNTGCSELYPNKKMTVGQHVELLRRLAATPGLRLVLLGGPEDTARNAEIARQVGDAVVNTPTREGLRRGLCYINVCDLVISGDSFGMHAAIGLKKHLIVWFGVTCPQEIDLFGRGIKLIPLGLECSPCWKKSCPFNLECIQRIDLGAIEKEVHRVLAERRPFRVASRDQSRSVDRE